MGNATEIGLAVFAVGAGALIANAKRRMLPSDEEQAWLDQQCASAARKQPSDDEQRWLEDRMKDSADADMLDDARQAGAQPIATSMFRLLPEY